VGSRIVVNRKDSAGFTPAGRCVGGVGERDLTPHLGIPMAGYAVAGQSAEGVCDRLFARVLYLEDAEGNRVALCFADLMSGTRYLLERVAARTAGVSGITVDRLLLSGTHTHTGPGWIYGNSLYDTFAQSRPGFDRGLADWLAERIAEAVVEAATDPEPVRVAVRREAIWDVNHNRSIPAFHANRDREQWNRAPYPGQDPPAHLDPDDPDDRELLAVDPRLTVITAVRPDDSILAAFGTFGCHTTTLGTGADHWSPDWAGTAVRRARRTFYAADRPRPAVAATAAASGDMNGMGRGRDQGRSLARRVGRATGVRLAEIAMASAGEATEFRIDARYFEPRIRDRIAMGDPTTELSDDWQFGVSTLCGGEDGRTFFHDLGVREGATSDHYPEDDPQRPKAPALHVFQDVLEWLAGVSPTPVYPLHQVRIGGHLFATVPGEPSVMAAHRIERELRGEPGVDGVTVLGYAGDYGGYFTTREEYGEQQYEGASMLYGRNASRHLAVRHVELARMPGTPKLPKRVTFRTGPSRRVFHAASEAREHFGDPEVSRKGRRVEVVWKMPSATRILFAEGWWARVEVRGDDGGWAVLEHHGMPFDDVHFPFRTMRNDLASWLPIRETWSVELLLPKRPPDRPLRLRIAPRDEFPGFHVRIPD